MNGQEWAEILVPLIFFSALVAAIGLLLLYKYKKKKLFLEMVERTLQQTPLPPETIHEVATHFFSSNADIRKGIFLLVMSASVFAFSYFADFRKNGNLDLNDALNGIAVMPGLFGLAFLLLARLNWRR